VTPIPGEIELKKAFEVQNLSGDQAARAWFEKAKNAGNIEADFQLNLMDRYPIIKGMSSTNDAGDMSEHASLHEQKDALKYILDFTFRSAKQGNLVAENRIWKFFIRDHGYLGYPADMVMTRKWMMMAAAQGSADAEIILGECYNPNSNNKLDFGIPVDETLARYWYGLAAAQGITEAKEAVARLDSENAAVTVSGLVNSPVLTGSNPFQTVQLDSPITLINKPFKGMLLCPIQKIDRYMPYAKISGNLHWVGIRPQMRIEEIKFIHDQGSHLVNSLTLKRNYVPGMILVKFKDDISDQVIKNILSKIGKAQPFSQKFIKNDYSVKLKKGMTVRAALQLLVNRPEVEFAEPNFRELKLM